MRFYYKNEIIYPKRSDPLSPKNKMFLPFRIRINNKQIANRIKYSGYA